MVRITKEKEGRVKGNARCCWKQARSLLGCLADGYRVQTARRPIYEVGNLALGPEPPARASSWRSPSRTSPSAQERGSRSGSERKAGIDGGGRHLLRRPT